MLKSPNFRDVFDVFRLTFGHKSVHSLASKRGLFRPLDPWVRFDSTIHGLEIALSTGRRPFVMEFEASITEPLT